MKFISCRQLTMSYFEKCKLILELPQQSGIRPREFCGRTSTTVLWENFHNSLDKAKRILEKNQYPPTFYELINRRALNDILGISSDQQQVPQGQNTGIERKPIFIQYLGKCTEDYARALHKIKAPCVIVMTLRKLKTVLPSLKPSVEKLMKSGVVYQLTCLQCSACYFGQTGRHMQTRLKEHLQRAGPKKSHITQCNATLISEYVDIIHSTSRGEGFLLTLEALHIRERKPSINIHQGRMQE